MYYLQGTFGYFFLVKHFRHYLWGRPFKIRTDHASLIWHTNLKNPEGILARWIAALDTYGYSLEHRKGKLHSNADSLSRRPHRKCARDDCPDCTNESIAVISVKRDEKSLNRVCLLMATQDNYDDTQTQLLDSVVEGDEMENVVPNWLSVWTDEKLQIGKVKMKILVKFWN